MNRDSVGREYRLVRGSLRHGRVSAAAVDTFREVILDHYRNHPRRLPWRYVSDPYRILVSEIMLQQTQVERVMDKYEEFLRLFPGFPALAGASLADVLAAWQGLGYNRRGMNLWEAARVVMTVHGGRLPRDQGALTALPGIGPATAGALAAFAFRLPSVFVETNIRRVFIHFFFPRKREVSEREILALVEKTLHRRDPRSWYYALMDYGAALKKHVPNPNRRSRAYRRQSPFEGSDRQVRSAVVKILLAEAGLDRESLVRRTGEDPRRAGKIIEALRREGIVRVRGGRYSIG